MTGSKSAIGYVIFWIVLTLGLAVGVFALLYAVSASRAPAQAATATPRAIVVLPTQAVVIPTVTAVPPTATASLTPLPTASPTLVATRPVTITPGATITATAGEAVTGTVLLTMNLPANVRSGPGVFYPVLAGLDAGTQTTVIGRDASSQWFVIPLSKSKDGRGWVSAQVATFTGEAGQLAVLTAPPPPPTPIPPTPAPAPKPVVSARGLTGELVLCGNKTAYGVGERVCFNEKIYNTTANSISYGVLGVLAVNTSGGGNKFQTSWSGDLGIGPNCFGPTDKCGGGWEDGMRLTAPGSYLLYLQICYSSLDMCVTGGEWESLTGGIAITVN